MKRILALAVACLALSAAPAFSQQATTQGDPQHGQAIAKRWCAGCHAMEGQGRASDIAPPFATIAKDPRRAEAWRAFLSSPHGRMPPLQLSRMEIGDLVAYLDSLAKR